MSNPADLSAAERSRSRSRVLAAVALLAFALLVPTLAVAADWPQWRGPNRDGRSAETGLLQAWPEGGPPLAWKATGVGAGYSSVAVVGERIYTLGDLADGQYLFALSAKDGSHLWKTKLGPKWEDKYLGSRSTPTVDGDRVYALSTEGDLYCVATADGTVKWKRNLPADFGGSLMKAMGTYSWKFSESPLVEGGQVIVTPGSKEAGIVALDKMTGEEMWRTALGDLGPKGGDGAAYSSAVVSEAAGVRQAVQFVGRGVVGVALADGRLLWSYNRVANDVANIATPLIAGDRVFASSGYQTGAALIEVEREGEKLAAEEVYFLPPETFQNHHGGMILDGGHVYTGSGHNKGFPVCAELATGKLAWGPIRNEGKGSAAIAYADGRLYLRYQDGLMVLAEATPEAYREHGSFTIPDVRHESWSHPVISGGRLFLKEQDTLYVYDIAGKG